MKRSLTLVFFFLTAWFLFACVTNSCGCDTFDVDIEVAIEDAAGNDLLDPSTEGYFTEQDIYMYYEINGKLKRYSGTNPSKGFTIQSEGTGYFLYLNSNPTAGKKVATILRIKDHADIRLVTRVNGENGGRVEKVWYNDQLLWPVSGNDDFPRRITVTLE